MQSLNFNYQHKHFEKTIQLYGDRAGGQGNFEFAGLAEIEKIQFVLLKGNPQSLQHPADWRRYLRMLHLAHRIHKPVLLWDLPHIKTVSIDNPTSLELRTVINNTRMQLFQLSTPIISVYDETIDFDNVVEEVNWVDGTIVVRSDDKKDSKEEILKQDNLYYVSTRSAIPNKISEIFIEKSGKTKKELVERRLEALHNSENQ